MLIIYNLNYSLPRITASRKHHDHLRKRVNEITLMHAQKNKQMLCILVPSVKLPPAFWVKGLTFSFCTHRHNLQLTLAVRLKFLIIKCWGKYPTCSLNLKSKLLWSLVLPYQTRVIFEVFFFNLQCKYQFWYNLAM